MLSPWHCAKRIQWHRTQKCWQWVILPATNCFAKVSGAIRAATVVVATHHKSGVPQTDAPGDIIPWNFTKQVAREKNEEGF
jgi:hypothetical protein